MVGRPRPVLYENYFLLKRDLGFLLKHWGKYEWELVQKICIHDIDNNSVNCEITLLSIYIYSNNPVIQ